MIERYIEKTSFHSAKIVPAGGAGRGLGGAVLEPTLKLQKIAQVLDFQGFSDHLKCLIFNNLSLLQKISQVLDFQRFGVLEWLWSGFGVSCHFAKNIR